MSFLQSIGNFFRMDDDEYEEYEDEFDEDFGAPEEPVSRTSNRNSNRPSSRASRQSSNVFDDYNEPRQKSSGFMTSKPKVVSMSKSSMEVNVVTPHTFNDSTEICSTLLSGKPVIVNLEGFDPDEAQRIMDFISGCLYAIDGKLHKIAKYIFIFSPKNVDVSGDSLNIEQENISNTVPVLNRDMF